MICPSRIRRAATALAILGAVVTLASCSVIKAAIGEKGPALPVTYYVSRSGNDGASGTSPAAAWRTLAKLDNASIPPGSKILLRAGDTFTGQLALGKGDAGNPAKPVTIESYGTGAATIDAPGESGISVFDTAGVNIHNLHFVGTGSGNGISFYNDMSAGYQLKQVGISNVVINGFRNGIAIGGVHTGFADVQVTNSLSYGNVNAGLAMYGPPLYSSSPQYGNQDVTISGFVAKDNEGDPRNTSNSGNGIVLGSVSNGSITWSTATGNGGKGHTHEEGVGIWTYDSTGITIAHNLSYGNRTQNKIDGGGFDLDENTTNSVLEDNLSYGNDGAGYLVYSYVDNGLEKGDIVRNNISSNDVTDGSLGYGAITVTGYVSNLAVYQNTVVASAAAPAFMAGSVVQDVTVANNLFSAQSGPVIEVGNRAANNWVDEPLAAGAVTFRGNDYYSAGPWQLVWGSLTYGSLAGWQNGTSQEIHQGQSTGHVVDPQLAGPSIGLSVKSATDTAVARGFELPSGSPLSGAGLDLTTLGLEPSASNFLGQDRAIQHPDVGAL